MKYWLDTEFIDGGHEHGIELLSIGIVSEDGREFYAINAEADLSIASDWVKEHVLPNLNLLKSGYDHNATIEEIKYGLQYFTNPKNFGKPEFWGYYASYDWVVMCQVFGTMLDVPKGWPHHINDIKQLCDSLGNPKLPKEYDGHHALQDSRWIKEAHSFLLEYAKSIN